MKDASSNSCRIYFRISLPIRVIAFITLWAFLLSTAGGEFFLEKSWAAPDLPYSDNGSENPVSSIRIPEYLGTIRDSWSPPGLRTPDSELRTIIHIQDAHCNYFCQQKIAELVGYLNKEYGVSTVNLEGGALDYDLSPFTAIADTAARARASEHFVKEGIVNGAEYFAVNNPEKVKLWGIEDAELYVDNLAVYRDSIIHKGDVERIMGPFGRALSALKLRVFSKGLLEFDTKYGQYKAGSIAFNEYLSYLVKTASGGMIAAAEYPNIAILARTIVQEKSIDFRLANTERDKLIDAIQKALSRIELEDLVGKTVEFKAEKISEKTFYEYLVSKAGELDIDLGAFPELRKYTAYLDTYASSDKAKLLEEIDALEARIRQSLITDSGERELAELSKNFILMKNLFAITLTSADYDYYRTSESGFAAADFARFINKKAAQYNIDAKLPDDIALLDGYRKQMARFYELSLKRDAAFVRNLGFADSVERIAYSKKLSAKRYTLNADRVAILITGGFHTDNLAKLMRANNIAYVSIAPNFKNCDGYQCPYSNILSGGKTITIKDALPSVLSANLATASQLNPPIQRAVAERFGPSPTGIQAPAPAKLAEIERRLSQDIPSIMRDNGCNDERITHTLNVMLHMDALIRGDYVVYFKRLSKKSTVDHDRYTADLNRLRDLYNSLSERGKLVLRLAEMLHDIEYKPGLSKGHRERGADRARQILTERGLPADVANDAAEIILVHGALSSIGEQYMPSEFASLFGHSPELGRQSAIFSCLDATDKRGENALEPEAIEDVLSATTRMEAFAENPDIFLREYRLRFCMAPPFFGLTGRTKVYSPADVEEILSGWGHDPELIENWARRIKCEDWVLFENIAADENKDSFIKLTRLIGYIAALNNGSGYCNIVSDPFIKELDISKLSVALDPLRRFLEGVLLEDITKENVKSELVRSGNTMCFGLPLTIDKGTIILELGNLAKRMAAGPVSATPASLSRRDFFKSTAAFTASLLMKPAQARSGIVADEKLMPLIDAIRGLLTWPIDTSKDPVLARCAQKADELLNGKGKTIQFVVTDMARYIEANRAEFSRTEYDRQMLALGETPRAMIRQAGPNKYQMIYDIHTYNEGAAALLAGFAHEAIAHQAFSDEELKGLSPVELEAVAFRTEIRYLEALLADKGFVAQFPGEAVSVLNDLGKQIEAEKRRLKLMEKYILNTEKIDTVFARAGIRRSGSVINWTGISVGAVAAGAAAWITIALIKRKAEIKGRADEAAVKAAARKAGKPAARRGWLKGTGALFTGALAWMSVKLLDGVEALAGQAASGPLSRTNYIVSLYGSAADESFAAIFPSAAMMGLITGLLFIIYILFHYQVPLDLFKRHVLDHYRVRSRSKRIREKIESQNKVNEILAKRLIPSSVISRDEVEKLALFLDNNNPMGSVLSRNIEKGDKILLFQVPGTTGGNGYGTKELNEIIGTELTSDLIAHRRKLIKGLVESAGIGTFLYSNYKEEAFVIKGVLDMNELETIRKTVVAEMSSYMRKNRHVKKAFRESGHWPDIRSNKALYSISVGVANVDGDSPEAKLTADINAHQAIIMESILRSAGILAPPIFARDLYKQAIEKIRQMRQYLAGQKGIFEEGLSAEGHYILRDEIADILRKKTDWKKLPQKELFGGSQAVYETALNYFAAMGIQDYIKKWQLDEEGRSKAFERSEGINSTISELKAALGACGGTAITVDGDISAILDRAFKYINEDPRIPAAQTASVFHARAPPLPLPVYISLDAKKMGLKNIRCYQREIQDIERLVLGPDPDMDEVAKRWARAADTVTKEFAENVDKVHRLLDPEVNTGIRSYTTYVGGDEIIIAADVFDLKAITPELLHEIRRQTHMRVAATMAINKFRGKVLRRISEEKEKYARELAHARAMFALDDGIAAAKKLEAHGIHDAVMLQDEHGRWHKDVESSDKNKGAPGAEEPDRRDFLKKAVMVTGGFVAMSTLAGFQMGCSRSSGYQAGDRKKEPRKSARRVLNNFRKTNGYTDLKVEASHGAGGADLFKGIIDSALLAAIIPESGAETRPGDTGAGIPENTLAVKKDGVYEAGALIAEHPNMLTELARQIALIDYNAHYQRSDEPDPGRMAKYMDMLANDANRFNVYIMNGKAVGFVWFAPSERIINNVAVDALAENRGIAHILYDSAINYLIAADQAGEIRFWPFECVEGFRGKYLSDRSENSRNGLSWWLEATSQKVPGMEYGGEYSQDKSEAVVRVHMRGETKKGPSAGTQLPAAENEPVKMSREEATIASFAHVRERDGQPMGVIIPICKFDTDTAEGYAGQKAFSAMIENINGLLKDRGLGSRIACYEVSPKYPQRTLGSYREANGRIDRLAGEKAVRFSFVPAEARQLFDGRNSYLISDAMSDGGKPDIMVRLSLAHHFAYYLRHPGNRDIEERAKEIIIRLLRAVSDDSAAIDELQSDLMKLIRGFILRIRAFDVNDFKVYRDMELEVARAA